MPIPNTPRSDGMYLRRDEGLTEFFRFAPDGLVENIVLRGTEVTADTAREMLDGTLPERRMKGSYRVEDDRLTFEIISSNGKVAYVGSMTDEGLLLSSHSHINGHSDTDLLYAYTDDIADRKLYEMVPRCLRIDCGKVNQTYEHGCGILVNRYGWPLPGTGETVVSRWNVSDGRLLLNQLAVPGPPHIPIAECGLLVTDRGIRGSFYKGQTNLAGLHLKMMRYVFTFWWPFELMADVSISWYKADRRARLMINDPSGDGHLGLRGVCKTKGVKDDDFLAPAFSLRVLKDQLEDLAQQVAETRQGYLDARAQT